MGRTIADYFKIDTGEQHNLEEDLWGSSGDRDFFEGTSDQILVNWEMYSGSRVTGPRTRLEQPDKETTGEPLCQEDPAVTGLGYKETTDESLLQEVSTVEDIPTIEEEDDLWREQLVKLGKYREDDKNKREDGREDDLGEEDDLWVSQLYTDVDYSLLDTPTNLNGRRLVTSHEGWSRSATLVELQISPKEKMVVLLQGATES